MPLRVASYNIAHGRGVALSNWNGGDRDERIARLDKIAGLLSEIDADVVILNEVDFDSSWSHSVNQAQYLAEKAGFPYRIEQRNLDFRFVFWKWRFGNAVLSKFPITNAQVVDLPGYSILETILVGKKRGVICDLQLGEREVRLIGVHLSHRSESVRVSSAVMLVDLALESALPTILAGDMNSSPPGFSKSATDPNGKNAIEIYDSSGIFKRLPMDGPPANDQLTFHSNEPDRVIDWILIPADWQFLQYNVELSKLSDHRPVYADISPDIAAKIKEAD